MAGFTPQDPGSWLLCAYGKHMVLCARGSSLGTQKISHEELVMSKGLCFCHLTCEERKLGILFV